MSTLIQSFLKIMCLMCLCSTSISRHWPKNMKWEHALGQWHVDKCKTFFNKEPEALVHIFSKQKYPSESRFVPNPHHAVLPTSKEGPHFVNASSSNSSFNIIHKLNHKGSITFITVTSVSSCLLLLGIALGIVSHCHKARSYSLEWNMGQDLHE